MEESDNKDSGRVIGAPFGGLNDNLDAVFATHKVARKATKAEARIEAEVEIDKGE